MVHNIIANIEDMMRKRADEVAVQCDALTYTYRDLDYASSHIASFLQARNMGPEDLIAIYMERSWVSVCATLGILRSGAAFLPIDQRTPAHRSAHILEVAQAKMVISDVALSLHGDCTVVPVATLFTTPCPAWHPVAITVSNLAYVIFTSGSTGVPKGVMIEHGGLLNHVLSKINLLQLSTDSVVAHNASIGFDISIWQILAPLSVGGQLVIFPEADILHVKKFIHRLRTTKVTVLEVVPTYLHLLLAESAEEERLEALQYVLSTGQELTPAVVTRWFARFPDIPLINAYGPTEASDDVAHYILTKDEKYERVPIGRPIPNVEFEIHYGDATQSVGELYVKGCCVGRGYIGNELETHQRFTRDETSGMRVYKTGDLVSQLPDGNYVYHGRMDDQIKLHGHRIELGEIEHTILSFGTISETVVLFDSDQADLQAVVVAPAPIDIEALRQFLKTQLPDYMVPLRYRQLPQIPVDSNGKTDRHQLTDILAAPSVVMRPHPSQEIYHMVQTIASLPQLPDDEAWKEDLTLIGFDSLSVIKLIVTIEETYGFEFEDAYLQPDILYNVNKLCEYIANKIQ